MGKGKDADSIGDVVEGIERIAEKQDDVSIDDLLDEFGDRSFAPLMAILALVGVSPVGGIPTMPTIIAACIAVIAVQMAFGRRQVWLPKFVTNRGVSSRRLKNGMDTFNRIARALDTIAKGRLGFLAGPTARRAVAGVIVVLCLALPVLELVPFAAAGPFLAIAVLSLAMMVRDGMVMMIGVVLALAALIYGISWFAG